jgi:hypothetical protein
MKIIDQVLAKKAALEDPGVANENKKKAIAAVTGGIKSAGWKAYMEQFARKDDGQLDTDQLMRLLATDGTANDPALIECRAYMVGNGVCGLGTKGSFDELVRSIDRDLSPNCEST